MSCWSRLSQRARWPWGYELTFDPGAVTVEIEWIDQMFPADDSGYAPLANTIRWIGPRYAWTSSSRVTLSREPRPS